jgi:ABC-type uncharacterized transport system substrate-binding protein
VCFFALFAMRILTLALGILVAPFAAEAQPPGKVYRIGYLDTTPTPAHLWDALLDGLRERGYSEGRNLVFERRFSEGNAERFPEFAAEMVRLRVDLILVITTPAALAAQHATQTIPIVMTTAIDPVGAGLVASLAQPGGNVTGLTPISPDLVGKRLEFLKDVVPGLSRVVVLWNAANPANASVWQERRRRPVRWASCSNRRTCGARRTSRARSPSRPRRAWMRSSSWGILSSICTDNTLLRSPPRSTFRAGLPAGNGSWLAV